MSLIVDVHLNTTSLHRVVITRTRPGTPEPDDENLYLVSVLSTPEAHSPLSQVSGSVTHRYGDGALVLVRKALEALT